MMAESGAHDHIPTPRRLKVRKHRRSYGRAGFCGGSAGSPPDKADQTEQTDPTTQYEQPEHTDEQQPHPGLSQTMQDRPDHGEDSYRGSDRLTGKRAVITGADSGIGRAVALAFAREGVDMVLSYLAEEEADADETVRLVEAEGRRGHPLPRRHPQRGDLPDHRRH